jgi:uncharacterized protein YndB with AHSA1/START domain
MDSTTYLLRAPRDQVWDAISDASHFGFWFGAEIDGQFAPGAVLTGRIIPTRTHPGIGRAQKPYLGATFEISIVSVEPKSGFSFRWQPVAAAPGTARLVSFELDEAPIGTSITIAESGHDDPPGTPAGQLVAGGLWRTREMALLLEKFLAGAIDLRPQPPRSGDGESAT